MNAFEKGWLAGAASALSASALWLALAFGVGVHKGAYDWPFMLFRTSLWVADDALMAVFLVGLAALSFSVVRRRLKD